VGRCKPSVWAGWLTWLTRLRNPTARRPSCGASSSLWQHLDPFLASPIVADWLRWHRTDAVLDIGQLEPVRQSGPADADVGGELGDRGLTGAGERDHVTTDSPGEALGMADILPVRIGSSPVSSHVEVGP
jgi:hypothetical protein